MRKDMLRTPIKGDTGPDERDERFAVALALLLPEQVGEPRLYHQGSVTLSVVQLASEGWYRCCGYPTTAILETWPPMIEELPHLLPAIREIWMQCYTQDYPRG
jgi:hypothetical protein